MLDATVADAHLDDVCMPSTAFTCTCFKITIFCLEVAADFLEYHVGLIKNGMLSLQKNIWKTFNNIAALFPNNRHACMVEDWTKTTHKGIDHK
jgi:hypothetical protein